MKSITCPRHLGRVPAISEIRVQPVLGTRHLGLTVREVRFSDGLVARFRALRYGLFCGPASNQRRHR
jgi:hypothetical protein